jgi:superoxide dismutase, Fe-Mn family
MSDKKPNSRRDFILSSAKAGLAIGVGMSSLSFIAESCIPPKYIPKNAAAIIPPTGFKQAPLAYDYKALEPVIDTMTMEIHYSKHAAAYSKNLNDEYEAVYGSKADKPATLEAILATASKQSAKMRNNGGGHYNHELFWKCMTPNGSGKADGKLLEGIEKTFGNFDAFKTQFNDAAKARFGSGWAWLLIDTDKKLRISSTPNQDNPLMDLAEIKGTPLLGLDVWEHAYYLKYQNKRADYITNWWSIVNWKYVGERYNLVMG